MFLTLKDGDEKPNLLFIIDFVGDNSVVFHQVAAVAQSFLKEDEYIDIVPMDSSFGRNATKDSAPFYKKS